MCGLETFPVVPHHGPLSPYDPEKVALHLLVDSGMLPACWLMSDYLQGPGVSQRPARPTPGHPPAPLLGLKLVRAHLGAALNIHPDATPMQKLFFKSLF